MAQAVLSREDPRETFFKALPQEPAPVEITYPVREGWEVGGGSGRTPYPVREGGGAGGRFGGRGGATVV